MPNLYDYNSGLNEDALRNAILKMRGNVQVDSQENFADMGFQQRLKQAMQRGQAGVPTSIADIQQEQAQQVAPMAEAPDPEMPIAGQGGGFMNVASDPMPDVQHDPGYHDRMMKLQGAGKLPLILTGNPNEGPHQRWRPALPAGSDPLHDVPAAFQLPYKTSRLDRKLDQRVGAATQRAMQEVATSKSREAAFRNALNKYNKQTEMDGPQAFSAAGVNPGMQAGMVGDGIPENAMRRANGTAVSYGEANGVKYVQGPNGRRIPMSNGMPAVAQGPSVGEGMAMIGSDPVDTMSQDGQMALSKKLKEMNSPGRPSSQRALLEKTRAPDEVGMSFEDVMARRHAGAVQLQNTNDAEKRNWGTKRDTILAERMRKFGEAQAAGPAMIEEAKARALAERLGGQGGGRGNKFPDKAMEWQAYKDDKAAWHANPSNQGKDMPDEVNNRLMDRYGLRGGQAGVPSGKPQGTGAQQKVAEKKEKFAAKVTDNTRRLNVSGMQEGEHELPDGGKLYVAPDTTSAEHVMPDGTRKTLDLSKPEDAALAKKLQGTRRQPNRWQAELPQQGQYSGWGNWQGR